MTIINTNSISGINSITAQGASGVAFYDSSGSSEQLRIDSGGRLLAGLNASVDSNSTLQVEGRNTITAIRYSAGTGNSGSKLELSRSASNTVGTTAAVSATDELGEIRFRGASTGSAFNTGAVISAVITSGTISASSFPTDLLFKTTNNGAASATERLRITSGGQIGVGNDDPTYKVSVKDTKADGTGVQMHLWNNSVDNTAGNVWSGIRFSTSTSDYETAEIKGWRKHPGTDLNSLSINTGGVERMVLSSSGVGIGTDNPTKALHIAQNSDCAIRIDANNSNANARAWEIIVGGNASNNAEMVLRTRQDNGTGGSECARFTRSGSIKLPSGGGINFHNYGTGTNINSNLLDDYEEGNFTPEIFGLGSLAGNYGHYVKVGNLVTCMFFIDIGTKTYIGSGSGTNSLQIILPFTNNNVTNSYAGVSIGNIRYIDFSSGSVKQFAMNIGGSSNRLTGRWVKHNSNFVDVVLGDLYNNFSMHASVTYQAT